MDEEAHHPRQDARCPMPIKRISRDDARLWFIQAGGYFTFLLVIPYEFFLTKSLKNHSAKSICCQAFCLGTNARELSNLLTLSISLEAPICPRRPSTS